MDSELYDMLELYKSKGAPLSIKDVMLLCNVSDIEASKPIIWLFEAGYLKYSSGYLPTDGTIAADTKLRLTYAGELAMRGDKRAKRAHFWIEFRSWFTLAIAFIALVLSIISLVLQVIWH